MFYLEEMVFCCFEVIELLLIVTQLLIKTKKKDHKNYLNRKCVVRGLFRKPSVSGRAFEIDSLIKDIA